MSQYDPTDWPSEADKESALDEFAAEMRATEARQKAVPLNNSPPLYPPSRISFGPVRRLAAAAGCASLSGPSGMTAISSTSLTFCHGLDGPLTDAVIIVFQAAIVGVLSEDHLRNLLVESGEMARWDSAQRHTPEHLDVFYPPYLSARSLKDLAAAAEHYEQSQQ